MRKEGGLREWAAGLESKDLSKKVKKEKSDKRCFSTAYSSIVADARERQLGELIDKHKIRVPG